MAMQSTGQGAMQSSQPVQCAASTVCIACGMPTIASTGQARAHRLQPMHSASSTRATRCRLALPPLASSGSGSRPRSAASRSIVSVPPGGQRLISAAPLTIAAA